MKRTYLSLYEQELVDVSQSVSRETHSARGEVITAKPGAKYLNSRHKALAGDCSPEPVCLSIQPDKGFFSWFKRLFTKYPLVSQAFKWTLIALSVAGLLYVTGGLAAIPLLEPIVAKLGALSLVAFSPAIGVALATLWYGAAKPILLWCANKFFYPHYAMRTIETPKVETEDSTRMVMDILGDDCSQVKSPTISPNTRQGQSPIYATVKLIAKLGCQKTAGSSQHHCPGNGPV